MKKRFVVCVETLNKTQDQNFINYLRKSNLAWWHWIPNIWLIVDKNAKFTARDIRNKIAEIYYNQNNFVLEISEDKDTWAGSGPKTETRNMFKWIRRNWNKKEI